MNKNGINKAGPLSLLLVCLLVLVAPAAYASTSTTGSGTFTATIASSTTVFSQGGFTLYFFTGSDVFTGTIAGTGSFTLHLLAFPSGAAFGAGSVTCSCTVGGKAGTVNILFTSKGTFGGPGSGQGVVIGSGGLAGLHGHSTFQYVTTATGFTGPYQVQFEFDE